MFRLGKGAGRPSASVDSTAMNTRVPLWHSAITAYNRLRADGLASSSTMATVYSARPKAASSQNIPPRAAKPRRSVCSSTTSPLAKNSRTLACAAASASCSCKACTRARCASSSTQRAERCSANAPVSITGPEPPDRPTRAWPAKGLSAGVPLLTSSGRSLASARQVASTCAVSANQRARPNKPRQPSKAVATSKRSRQPIQRDRWADAPTP